MSAMNPRAEDAFSPDRGDERVGVAVTLGGHRAWLTIDETHQLIVQAARAVANAEVAQKATL